MHDLPVGPILWERIVTGRTGESMSATGGVAVQDMLRSAYFASYGPRVSRELAHLFHREMAQ
jgi:hypothetical protein